MKTIFFKIYAQTFRFLELEPRSSVSFSAMWWCAYDDYEYKWALAYCVEYIFLNKYVYKESMETIVLCIVKMFIRGL